MKSIRRSFNSALSVGYSFVRFGMLKLFHGKNLTFHSVERFSPATVVEMEKGSQLHLGNMVRVHSGSKLKVRSGAVLSIGSNTQLNYNDIVICRDGITIGDGVEIGPDVLIYDHDHGFDPEHGVIKGQFHTAPVTIGEHSWIGAGTIILKGVHIGRCCVVAAGSVVTHDLPDGTVLLQKRTNIEKKLVKTR